MKKSEAFLTIGTLIVIGVFLRMTDLAIPDLATDEAQALFSSSAAWTPLGMWILKTTRMVFGDEIVVIRFVSVFFGILTLPLIYLTTKEFTNKKTAVLAVIIASLFPSHILFSRLAYLSVQQCFWWIAVLFCYFKARKNENFIWYLALFLTSVAATMTKTQGLLLPLFLLAGIIMETICKHRGVTPSSPPERSGGGRIEGRHSSSMTMILILIFSLLPVTFYILTKPGIAATLFLYTGNMYGVSGPFDRIIALIATWWRVIGFFLIALIVSISTLRKLPWPFLILLAIGTLIGFLLGAGHEYYTTHLVLWSIPIAMVFIKLKPALRSISVAILLLFSVMTLGPTGLLQNKWTYELYQERGFWNTYAAEINAHLEGKEAVTAIGDIGHHVRWYVEPRVLVGKNMERPYPTNYVLVFGVNDAANVSGKIVEVFEHLAVVRQNN